MTISPSSTQTSTPAGPGVVAAEDPAMRNRILFAVIGSIVGLSIIIAIAFVMIKRRHSRLDPSTEFNSNIILPPIQPDMNTPPKGNNPVSNESPIEASSAQSPGHENNQNSVPRGQERHERRFREQQQRFKEKRDLERMKAEGRLPEPRSSPRMNNKSRRSMSSVLPVASTKQEQEVLDILTMNIEMDPKQKHGIYKDLLIQWHPDKHSDDKAVATKVFQFLQSRKEWFLGLDDNSPSP